METLSSQIDSFFAAPSFAVVGASNDPEKYGHKCFRCYLEKGLKAYPVNPYAERVIGNKAFPDLASLPEPVQSVSIITPPAVTEIIVDDAITCGVKNIWMQPGAESWPAIAKAKRHGINVIAGGPCILVTLRCRVT